MMENEEGVSLRNMERVEAKLRLEEILEDDILEKIATYKALSMKIGEKIQKITWKLSQAEFIYSCEVKKRGNYLCKIERSNLIARKCEIPNRPECCPDDPVASIESISARLEILQRTNIEKMESISRLENEIDALKKENDATLQKLMKEVEEWENEEGKLEDMLEQIQFQHSDHFHIC